MNPSPLIAREIFHLEFLRRLANAIPLENFALKGGCNMRFFFGSARYSEDMDIDVAATPVHTLQDHVMGVLSSTGLKNTLQTFGIERLTPQDIARAKQTETVQRFKVRLLTSANEDFPTKIEFSRRGLDAPVAREAISSVILAAYRVPPLIVPHYPAVAAFRQKLRALVGRRQPMARDIFDLYVLSPRPELAGASLSDHLSQRELEEAGSRIYSIEYKEFRDTVVNFLGPEDQRAYSSRDVWDEVRLRVVSLIDGAHGRGSPQ